MRVSRWVFANSNWSYWPLLLRVFRRVATIWLFWRLPPTMWWNRVFPEEVKALECMSRCSLVAVLFAPSCRRTRAALICAVITVRVDLPVSATSNVFPYASLPPLWLLMM